jgi:hypothetical protein
VALWSTWQAKSSPLDSHSGGRYDAIISSHVATREVAPPLVT